MSNPLDPAKTLTEKPPVRVNGNDRLSESADSTDKKFPVQKIKADMVGYRTVNIDKCRMPWEPKDIILPVVVIT